MRSFGMAVSAVVLCAVAVVALTPEPAQAHRCTIFKASHNGTDMFNPDGGAKGTAIAKLMDSIEMWRQKKGYKRVRIGKVKTRCDPWTLIVVLPHHRCYASARVCR